MPAPRPDRQVRRTGYKHTQSPRAAGRCPTRCPTSRGTGLHRLLLCGQGTRSQPADPANASGGARACSGGARACDPRLQHSETSSLFAALDIASGDRSSARCMRATARPSSRSSSTISPRRCPPNWMFQLILDSYTTHKTRPSSDGFSRTRGFYLYPPQPEPPGRVPQARPAQLLLINHPCASQGVLL